MGLIIFSPAIILIIIGIMKDPEFLHVLGKLQIGLFFPLFAFFIIVVPAILQKLILSKE